MADKGFRFTPNEDGIHEVSTGAEVGKLLTQYARDAARNIKRLAPTKRGFMDYRKNVKAIAARRGPDGFEAQVVVDTPVWHLPEYGTAEHRATAPIRKGVKETGIQFEEN